MTEQRKASAVSKVTISSVPKVVQLAEDSRRKSANMMVANVIRLSGSQLEPGQVGTKGTSGKKETKEQKRVIVKEVRRDDQVMNDDVSVKNGQRMELAMAKTMPNQLDNVYITTVNGTGIENGILSSDTNVKSLTIDYQTEITLTKLEATTFACVLRECLEFLNILRYVIPAEIDERWDESYKTIAELYGVPDEPRMIFREDMGLLPLIPSIAEKLQRDRTYIYDVLHKTMCEIKTENICNTLELTIDNIVKTEEGERELEINCQLWTEQAKQLQQLIEYDKIEFEKNRRQKIQIARQVNADVDNSIFLNGSELGYVERWEESQIEKQKLKLEQQEAELLKEKTKCENLEKADQLVSGEVKTYLEANTREMEDEIISWTSQYIEELERRQQEMTEFRDHIEEQLIEIEELSKWSNARQAFIDEVLAEKARIKTEEEYWREIHRVATLIQAHWRGYMVRKQIGPFKGLWASLKKRKGLGGSTRKKNKKSAKSKK